MFIAHKTEKVNYYPAAEYTKVVVMQCADQNRTDTVHIQIKFLPIINVVIWQFTVAVLKYWYFCFICCED